MNKRHSQVVILSLLIGFLLLKPLSASALEVEGENTSSIQVTGKIGQKTTVISKQVPERNQLLVIDNSAIQRKQLPKLASQASKMAWLGWLLIICWLLCLGFKMEKEIGSVFEEHNE